MIEHRKISNGEDNVDTCTACEWASWDTAPSFAEHVELMAAIDAEALSASEPEDACIAPPGNLCTDAGCWDADRCIVARPSARESAWAEFRDGPDYTPTDRYPVRDAFDAGWSLSLVSAGSEGWAAYAAEQERHAETACRLEDMTREARLSRESAERAVRTRIARHELERAFRAADAPEDSMATDDDLIRYEGRAEAVAIMRDMLGLAGAVCRAPGYNGIHVAVGAGAIGSPPYVCHGCGGTFTPENVDA